MGSCCSAAARQALPGGGAEVASFCVEYIVVVPYVYGTTAFEMPSVGFEVGWERTRSRSRCVQLCTGLAAMVCTVVYGSCCGDI